VWRALTEPAELGAWFWPFPTAVELDPRPGGRFRLDAPARAMGVTGTIAAAAEQRLETSWRWDGEEGETHVGFAVEPSGAGTRVRVTHTGFPDDATRDDHIQGWNDCLARLPDYLARARD
jgi:uncharacterized protein YndB with AHSA1/START domain